MQAIGEIRRALGERKGEDRFVQTIPRHGYRFVMPVTSGDEVIDARAPGSRWRRPSVRRPRRAHSSPCLPWPSFEPIRGSRRAGCGSWRARQSHQKGPLRR